MSIRIVGVNRGAAAAAVLLMVGLFSGCLESDIARHLKYDAENDSFEILSVFNHIRAQDAADLDHLGHLYEVRAELISPIAPISVFTEPAWIRKTGSTYLEANLGAAPDGAPEVKTTGIALDSIRVQPGRFFFNQNKMPAYAHRMTVPGKAFDGFLTGFDKFVNEVVGDMVKGEQSRRAQGHPVQAWDAVRAAMSKEPPEKQDETVGEFPCNACSEESLLLLAKNAAESKLKIVREKTRFRLVLPMTAADAKEAAATIELGRQKLLETAKKEKAAPEAVAVIRSIQAEAKESGELALSVDLGPRLSSGPDEPALTKTDSKHLDNAATVTGMKERGITFDETLTYAEVVKGFFGEQ